MSTDPRTAYAEALAAMEAWRKAGAAWRDFSKNTGAY